jgi:hypothetical protein
MDARIKHFSVIALGVLSVTFRFPMFVLYHSANIAILAMKKKSRDMAET